MPGPENIEARVKKAQLTPPSMLSRAIATRARTEADNLSLRIQQLRGDTEVENETSFNDHTVDITARAVMVYSPQPTETTWTPDSVPDYFTFNRTRLLFIPSAETLSLDHGEMEAVLDDNQDAATRAREYGAGIHKVLEYSFKAGSLLVPPVGATTELIKMQQVAADIGRDQPQARGADFAAANVYLKPSLYDNLQRSYYKTPDELMRVGTEAIGQVTGEAMARYEAYTDALRRNETLPTEDVIFVAERHEEAAEEQRQYRARALVERVDYLWPQ